MKKNNTKKQKNGGTQSQRVHFEFQYPAAESVFIAGTFNDWQPHATPLIALGQGRWAKDLALPQGDYEYRLVVDGEGKERAGAQRLHHGESCGAGGGLKILR